MQKCPRALRFSPGADGAATSQGSGGQTSSLPGPLQLILGRAELVTCSSPPGLGCGSPVSPVSTRLLWASFSSTESHLHSSKAP